MEDCKVITHKALAMLPPSNSDPNLLHSIAHRDASSPALVVLDDGPAGAHTPDNVAVLTVWDEQTLLNAFESGALGFLVLTSSRTLPLPEAIDLIRTICANMESAASRTGRKLEIVLRSPAKTTISNPAAMQYANLGRSGLKISKVILGCMSFGDPQWEGSPWILPEEEALPLLKCAYDAGINTWETANSYSNGWSESIIGKAMQKYDIPRSKLVIMSKVYYPVMEDHSRPQPAKNDGSLSNQMGLSRKHIFEAVEASLRRLNTSYIDVLQLHRLDRETDPREIMRALHDLVQMGKVHYLGGSSMRCWEFSRLQYIAKMNNWTTFSSMSGLWNLLYREEEREMVPFCEAEGIGLIPWSPIARGLLTRPWNTETERSQQDTKTKKWFQSIQNQGIVTRVEKLAEAKQCSMSDLAMAWLLHKGACPVVGLNSEQRIAQVSAAFAVSLTASDMRHLEELYQSVEVQAM